MTKLKLSCPCNFGLESVLSGELKRMGAEGITVTDGRVDFEGDWSSIAKANLWLRTAERVLVVLGTFKATSFTQLFDEVEKLPFENFVGKKDRFPVKGWSLNSQLHSVPDCQSIIKKAAVKRLGARYGLSWFEETGELVQIQFSIMKDMVTVMLDTSGAGLHKRGYRKVSNLAPIKETLAAGILDIARIYPDTQLYDPFCGSGTFLIEAAYKAKNIAPGLYRRFSAERWGCIPNTVWRQERESAIGMVRKEDVTFQGFGTDISSEAVEITRSNAVRASVSGLITTAVKDVRDFVPPAQKSIVVCNPPYGERLLTLPEAEALYRDMGRVFSPSEHTGYFIISSLENFETLFGRKADKRRKLYNGMVKCQLYMYFPQK
ncbi:MAG: class I SAM-dependent RNA methyltransferase [Angelakisella sp.]|nr:class I SAM-dependent RNA methyltransferase [Angelakisella sp.]